VVTFTKSGHLTVEALDLYVLRDLPPAQQFCAGKHVGRCKRCDKAREQAQEFVALLRRIAAAARPPGWALN
jgi:hypothetical protein